MDEQNMDMPEMNIVMDHCGSYSLVGGATLIVMQAAKFPKEPLTLNHFSKPFNFIFHIGNMVKGIDLAEEIEMVKTTFTRAKIKIIIL